MDNQPLRPPRVRFIALLAGSVLGVGVVFYHFVENWSWVDSFYFCVVTLATVGYGDITPQTDAGKIFTSFYILIGIGIFALSINYVVKRAAVRRLQKYQSKHPEKGQK